MKNVCKHNCLLSRSPHLQHSHRRLLPVHEALLDVPAGAPVVHARGVVLHLALLHPVDVDGGGGAGVAAAGGAVFQVGHLGEERDGFRV